MKPRRKPPEHSPEIRAAVLAALLAGQSVSQVAKEYKLPKGTVSAWKNRCDPSYVSATQKETTGETTGDLLHRLVDANLKALLAGAELGADLTWARTQAAAELATFYGVMSDKTFRMLEAMDRSQTETPAPPGT